MRPATLIRTTALVILAVGLWTRATGAEDPIKPGKWEFTIEMPEVAHLPPGTQLPPGVQQDAHGMSRTACITSANPLPPMAQGPSKPRDVDHPCKIDTTNVSGGTVSWSTSCITPKVAIHEEWVVHYHGETLDGTFVFRSALADHPPNERSLPVTGRYLGPCDNP